MKTYYVDVEMKFSVPARDDNEAKDIIETGFKIGKFVPKEGEIVVYEKEDGR